MSNIIENAYGFIRNFGKKPLIPLFIQLPAERGRLCRVEGG